MDVVPVDWVAGCLHHLLWRSALAHRLYLGSAGIRSRSSWLDLERVFRLHGEPSQSPAYRFINARVEGKGERFHRDFDAGLEAALPERSPLRRSLRRAARKYHRFIAQSVTFDNRRLLGEGTGAAPRFADYLGPCLRSARHSIAQPFLDDASGSGYRGT